MQIFIYFSSTVYFLTKVYQLTDVLISVNIVCFVYAFPSIATVLLDDFDCSRFCQ